MFRAVRAGSTVVLTARARVDCVRSVAISPAGPLYASQPHRRPSTLHHYRRTALCLARTNNACYAVAGGVTIDMQTSPGGSLVGIIPTTVSFRSLAALTFGLAGQSINDGSITKILAGNYYEQACQTSSNAGRGDFSRPAGAGEASRRAGMRKPTVRWGFAFVAQEKSGISYFFWGNYQ